MKRLRHVLHATDFSAASSRALDSAVDIAHTYNAKLTLVHVMSPLIPMMPEQYFDTDLINRIERQTREWNLRQLKRLAERAKRRGVRVTIQLREGDEAPQIVRAARVGHADLIVVGTHGRSGIQKFFLGSVADRVVRTST